MHRLVVADLHALAVAEQPVEQIARRAMGDRLDLGACADLVVQYVRVAVDLDAHRDMMVRVADDDEALALMQVHGLVVADPTPLVAVEAEEIPVRLVDEGFKFGSGAGEVVDVVERAVNFDLDGGVHRAFPLSRGAVRDRAGIVASWGGQSENVKRDTRAATFSQLSRRDARKAISRLPPACHRSGSLKMQSATYNAAISSSRVIVSIATIWAVKTTLWPTRTNGFVDSDMLEPVTLSH